MKLTFKEDNVLHAINSALEGEWTIVTEIHPRVPKMVCQTEKQTIGVIGSLAKKGLIECDTDEGVEWVTITNMGRDLLN